ncbi:MAG: ribosome recycling factor [Candidatus Gottesmanbacteria bacterium]|nr:ribosome recycling factor [Candidatus Gottesmanbacteria bacterium]
MIEPILNTARERMKKALDVTRTDLTSIRSGRATPALVENIVIMAYGGSQRLRVQEMATITTMDSKTIVISPYDISTISEIEKGIMAGNSGLTPVVDREIIRITIPMLSEERRLEYIKLAKAKLEGGRVMVRQIRGDSMRELKKAEEGKTISEDEQKHGERLVQELTDEMVAEIDTMGTRKEAELLQV